MLPQPRWLRRFTSTPVAATLAALLLATIAPAFAQDKATLDLLVKKNVITQDEADSVAKSSSMPVMVTPKDAAVKGLKLEGMIQNQFDWLTTKDHRAATSNSAAEEQFYVRRAYLGAVADLGNGWGGEILFDFAAGVKPPAGGAQLAAGTAAQNNFEKIIITKKVEDWNGQLTVGFQKVNFTLEEYTSSLSLKPIERSVVSNYFDSAYGNPTNRRLGFASRHSGIFWDGKVADSGIFYGVALTSGVQNSIAYAPTGGLNKPAGWAYLGYNGTIDSAKLTYKAGINVGYSADGNSNTGVPAANQSNSIWGYNPYVSVTWNKAFQLDAEFLQASIQNGRINTAGLGTSTASPYGFHITPSYKINDQFEIIARYAYLNTDGRGTNISDVVPNANNVVFPATAGGALFNDVQSFYVGVNRYLVGPSVKFLIGYEFDEFSHRQTAAAINDANLRGPRADVSGVRLVCSWCFNFPFFAHENTLPSSAPT